ncbi:MAG: response regulator [Sandaracinaceae bacterium]|nr:response regulator [Myxococcales bacterium]MCB9659546.1 response regulator [Sandaracinaceae bacterium]
MVASSVLLVIPDDVVRRRLVSAVERAGYECLGVPTGEAAIDAFVEQPMDIVCVALRLPGRDGSATVESLRWAPSGERTHMVLLGDPEDALVLQRETARLGAVTCLVGDVSDAGVLRVVENVVRQELRPDSLPPPSPEVGEQEVTRRYTLWDSTEGDFVERYLGNLPSHPGALHGDLANVPFVAVLAKLFEARATGALALHATKDKRSTTAGDSPKKVVFFQRGVPLSVRSNLVDECLGQLLYRRGVIDANVLEESLRRVRAGDGQQGAVLLSMDALTPHELRAALGEQIDTKLLDIFGWTAGTFEFTEMRPPQETVTLDTPLLELVMRGVRERIPPAVVSEVITRTLDHYAEPVAYRVAPFRRLPLPPECQALLERLDGQCTVRALLHGSAIAGSTLTAFVYVLLCGGAIKLADAPMPQVDTGALLPKDRPTMPPPALAGSTDGAGPEALQAFREGEAALASGDFEAAFSAFARARTLAADEGIYWVYLGYCRYAVHREDPLEADRALAETIVGCRLAPSAPDAHLLRARLLRSRSQWTAARNAYERVLHLDPDHREALAGLQAISSVCDA